MFNLEFHTIIVSFAMTVLASAMVFMFYRYKVSSLEQMCIEQGQILKSYIQQNDANRLADIGRADTFDSAIRNLFDSQGVSGDAVGTGGGLIDVSDTENVVLMEGDDDSDEVDTVTDDSNADDSVADDSNADDSVADDSNADDSNADDSNADDSVADDSVADDSNADDSNADDSVADDSVADDSVADDSNADDSVANNSIQLDAEDIHSGIHSVEYEIDDSVSVGTIESTAESTVETSSVFGKLMKGDLCDYIITNNISQRPKSSLMKLKKGELVSICEK
jgi:hypothetical protein